MRCQIHAGARKMHVAEALDIAEIAPYRALHIARSWLGVFVRRRVPRCTCARCFLRRKEGFAPSFLMARIAGLRGESFSLRAFSAGMISWVQFGCFFCRSSSFAF